LGLRVKNDQIGVLAAIEIRSRSTVVRTASMGFIALLIGLVGHWPYAGWWWLAYAATQVLFVQLARRTATLGFTPIYATSFVTFAIAGAPCWHLWTHVGMLGASAASMFLSGMLALLIASSLGARRLLVASATPLFGYMFAIPIFYFGPEHPAQMAGGVGCPLVLATYLSVVWRSQQQVLRAVEASRRTAEAATRAKSEFLAVMSHEIRTPLNAVLGCAELLRRTPLSGEQRRLLDVLSQGGAVLTQVINDVLDFSKIEAGRLSIEPAPLDVAELARRTAEFWRPRIEDAGLQLKVSIDAAAGQQVMADATRIEQILFNLVSNAVKFTERGAITLEARVASASDGGLDLEFSVTDTGIGMSAEVQSRLFTAFEQADGSISRRFGGTGLGLAISQKLAAMMGGAITVRSAEGVGSTFRLSLWAPPAPFEAQEATIEEPQPTAAPARLRILVAEDNPANRMIIEHFLRPLDAEVTIVNDGGEAVAVCAQQPFDVVLMDVQMPVIDGMEATRRIRAGAGPNANAPILALTADAFEAQREACTRAGMTGHVTKPIDSRALLTSITAAAARAEHAATA
jgi:signal transduction histidine kinase/CheY-like chemotaxis protein